MAKNAPKSGHSAKRGNTPAPYTKQRKREYKYGTLNTQAQYLARGMVWLNKTTLNPAFVAMLKERAS